MNKSDWKENLRKNSTLGSERLFSSDQSRICSDLKLKKRKKNGITLYSVRELARRANKGSKKDASLFKLCNKREQKSRSSYSKAKLESMKHDCKIISKNESLAFYREKLRKKKIRIGLASITNRLCRVNNYHGLRSGYLASNAFAIAQ